MSALDLTVYRTTDAEAIKAFTDWRDAREAWHKRLKKAMRELGVSKHTAMLTRSTFGERWVGVTVEGHSSDVPLGWRLDRKQWMLVPYKKLAEGKAVAKVIDATQPPAFPTPRGMLSWHLGSTRAGVATMRAGLELRDGYLYAIWGTDNVPETGTGDDGPVALIDRAIWEKVKVSEYVALTENDPPDEAAS